MKVASKKHIITNLSLNSMFSDTQKREMQLKAKKHLINKYNRRSK